MFTGHDDVAFSVSLRQFAATAVPRIFQHRREAPCAGDHAEIGGCEVRYLGVGARQGDAGTRAQPGRISGRRDHVGTLGNFIPQAAAKARYLHIT